MALRDVELDVSTLLEAAGLGSMSSSPPTLYAGRFPASAPDAMVACRFSGGDGPSDYLGGSGALHTPEVTVLVRGARNQYASTRALAAAAWEALRNRQLGGYVRVQSRGAGPAALGPDENGRERFSFTVRLLYSEP